ncbi:hypothetical protein JJJ17_19685 [Paracoccus caeni]|uniref:Recombinase family protein n=1 Tax=Paracoccus caeni TaxID=657651 RepID=A0A934SIK7_9RHOB|nr:hypothetical protein [Paracoccus caeni]MBK4218155.1 hypothetical protein [Paracoccus caeni]
MTHFVIYTRIGFEDQGQPDLSPAAQMRDIDFLLQNYETEPVVIARHADQFVPEGEALTGIQTALTICRKHFAKLLVARLDRLPVAQLGYAPFFADPSVDLRVAVLPHATKTELSIHARLQAQERAFHARQAAINVETRAAKGRCRAFATETEDAQTADQVTQIVLPMRQRGATLRDIASALNRAGLMTSSGTAWRPAQVSRLLQLMK